MTPEAEYDPPHKWFYTFKMLHKDFIFPDVTQRLYRSPLIWGLDSIHADIRNAKK